MENLFVLVALAIIVVLIVRYFVWASRFSQIKRTLDKITDLQEQFDHRLANVERKIGPKASGSLTSAEATALIPSGEPEPSVVEEVEPELLDQVAAFKKGKSADEEFAAAAQVGLVEREAGEQSETQPMPAEVVAPKFAAVPFRSNAITVAVRSVVRKAADATRETIGSKTTDWEALIGGRWLNVIGMVVLVIGIVLLTQQAVQHMTAAQKIGAGAILSVGMIIGGMLMERRTTYQRIGRTLIGGGWATLYFDAFAAHQVAQAKIIENPMIGLAALVIVAAGMIAHSLRYRSQLVTGLAFGLGFLAVVLAPPTLMSLVASALLAASLVMVTRFLSWHYLAIAGVFGTYLNHWNWLRVVTNVLAAAANTSKPMSGVTPEIGFWLSSVILGFYWVLFALVSLNRSITSNRDRNIHIGVNVANTIGMLGLMAMQIKQQYAGDYLFSLTGPAAVAYAVLSYLDRRFSQRHLFLFNATISLGLYCVTLPLASGHYGWNSGWLAPYLMYGALMAMTTGFWLREPVLRLEAYGLSAGVFCFALFINLRQPGAEHVSAVWFAVPALIVIFQGLSEWLQKRQTETLAAWETGALPLAFGIGATLMLAYLAWNQSPHDLAGLIWLALGLILFEIGARKEKLFLRAQSYLLLVFAVAAFLAVNFGYGQVAIAHAAAPRWMIITAAIVLYSYLYWRQLTDVWLHEWHELKLGSLLSFATTLLATLILWYELPSLGVAMAWCLTGLLLFELSAYLKTPILRVQAHALLIFAFVRLFMANFVIDGDVSGISFRLITVVPVILIIYYLRQRVTELLGAPEAVVTIGQRLLRLEARIGGSLYSYAGAILVVVLCRFEFGRAHTVAAWAPLVLIFLLLGRRFDNRDFRFQSYLLAIYSFFRAWSTNIYLDGHWLGIPERISTTLPMVLALFAAAMICLYPVKVEELAASNRIKRWLNYLDYRARTLFSVLTAGFLAVLLYFQFNQFGLVAASWSVEGLVFVMLGLWLKCRDFKFEGYVLALAAFALAIRFGVGESERLLTTIPVIAVLFTMALTFARHQRATEQIPASRLELLDSYGRMLFSLVASLLLATLLYYYLSIDRVSIGWAIEAFALMTLGFSLKDRNFRIYGLVLLFSCLLKVTFIDLAGAETIYRTLSFIVLGLILLLASLAYTRYRDVIGRYI